MASVANKEVPMNKKKFQKHLKYGTNSAIFTIAVVGAVILINLMLSSSKIKWDLTRDKIRDFASNFQ
jgi:hypothetical protein